MSQFLLPLLLFPKGDENQAASQVCSCDPLPALTHPTAHPLPHLHLLCGYLGHGLPEKTMPIVPSHSSTIGIQLKFPHFPSLVQNKKEGSNPNIVTITYHKNNYQVLPRRNKSEATNKNNIK